jgi:hypothetical protein
MIFLITLIKVEFFKLMLHFFITFFQNFPLVNYLFILIITNNNWNHDNFIFFHFFHHEIILMRS